MRRIFSFIVCVGTVAMFVAGVHWVWQMGCLARESAETARVARAQLEAIGAEVTGALADVKSLTGRLENFSRTAAAGAETEEKPRDAAADAQIEALLARIRDSDITWDSAEGEKPKFLLFGIVAAKYGMMKRSVVTPEDFITEVADADLFGKPLRVKEPNGVSLPLPEWLRREPGQSGSGRANGSPPAGSSATVAP